jgi:hypothetical protein
LFVATLSNKRYLTAFDGNTFSAPLEMPAVQKLYGVAQTSDGLYHVLGDNKLYSGDAQSGWGPGTPAPLPSLATASYAVMAATAADRIVIAYASGSPRHLFVYSKPPGGAWTAPLDVTPQWAVSAQGPKIVAPPGGGVVVAVTGASTNYSVPAVWNSPDGLSFTDMDPKNKLKGPVEELSADCLAAPLLILGSYVQHNLYAVSGTGFTELDSKSWTYINGSSARQLSDGKIFWGIGSTGTVHEYRATQ